MNSVETVCGDLQEQEWQVLQSIYPEVVPSEQPGTGNSFVLHVGVELLEPVLVHIQEENNSIDATHTLSVSCFPPLLVNVLLPSTYPLEDPPIICSLHASHDWLPTPFVELLKCRLLEMWCKECVLGVWVGHIRSGDFLEFIEVVHMSPKCIRFPHPTPQDLLLGLANYDRTARESHFRDSTHTCPICLKRLLGTHCIALTDCGHVTCRSCLGDFWGRCISEGSVERVGCPDPECVKSSRQASREDVEAIVSPDEVARWQWLLQKQEIERDPTIVHCPLAFCQRPVQRPPPAEDGQSSEWNRLRICECGFAFCVYCSRAWHGPHTSCNLLTTAEFVQMYIQHPADSPERLAIEKRHGRNNVLKLVAKIQEEQLNREYMENETMGCPGCNIRVQKNAGCNHMTCSKCRQHFCYLCGTKLEPANPYRHFNTRGKPCYSKLFDVQGHDEDRWIPFEGPDM